MFFLPNVTIKKNKKNNKEENKSHSNTRTDMNVLQLFPWLLCRSHRRGDPSSPYFVNSGYIFAPATSANDSEISSDATTDDSMSMTDSSV